MLCWYEPVVTVYCALGRFIAPFTHETCPASAPWMCLRALGVNGLPLVTDGSGRKDLQAAEVRRLEGKGLKITENTLKKIEVVIVLQDEGIIYCPIPKVNCFGPQSKRWTNEWRLESMRHAVLAMTRWWRPTTAYVAILSIAVQLTFSLICSCYTYVRVLSCIISAMQKSVLGRGQATYIADYSSRLQRPVNRHHHGFSEEQISSL